MFRQDRQVIISPLGVLGVIAVCICKSGQMAHTPTDTPAVALQIPVLTLNLIDSGRFEVKTANATIFVAPEQSYLLETRVIDGCKYLTIPVEEEIEVNGFGVRTQGEKQG